MYVRTLCVLTVTTPAFRHARLHLRLLPFVVAAPGGSQRVTEVHYSFTPWDHSSPGGEECGASGCVPGQQAQTRPLKTFQRHPVRFLHMTRPTHPCPKTQAGTRMTVYACTKSHWAWSHLHEQGLPGRLALGIWQSTLLFWLCQGQQ